MFASQCISLNIIISAHRVFEARTVHALAIFMCDKFQRTGWLLCKTQKLVRTMSQADWICARARVCARIRAGMRVCARVCTRRVCVCALFPMCLVGLWIKQRNNPIVPPFSADPGLKVPLPDGPVPYDFAKLFYTDNFNSTGFSKST